MPTLAVIGDTQNTLWVERVFLRREDNAYARKILVQNLSAAKFEALIHLGDMVENGASPRAWQEFDHDFAGILQSGAKFIPMMGNHDYWGNVQRRRINIATRFPQLVQQSWRAEVFYSLGLICIDSNRSRYSRATWAEQERWFEKTLNDFTEAPSIGAILIFSHHPPFTNSAVMARAKFLETTFLPAFFSSSKTKVFISGHVHGYERFMRQDKIFLVSGGGGGPRLPLRRVERRHYVDQCAQAEPRPLHYLLLHLEAQQFRFAAWGLRNNEAHVSLFDEIVIPLDSGLTS